MLSAITSKGIYTSWTLLYSLSQTSCWLKLGMESGAEVFLCIFFFLDKPATLQPCADYLKSDFSEGSYAAACN